MRVKFATQVFSKTVQAAIRTVCDTNGFKKNTNQVALCTAEFIKSIDKIFDCMNSGSLYGDNPFRSALQLHNEPYKFIQTFLKDLEEVKFVDEKKKVFFLDGMKLTLKSVLLITDEILDETTDKFFVMTKSFNQDKLENTFAVLRQKGGNNSNPSVAELNNILARLMSTKIVQSSTSSNCEPTQDSFIQIISNTAPDETFSSTISNKSFEDAKEEQLNGIDFHDEKYADYFLEDSFCNRAEINLELVSIRYFVGYVAYKIVPKLNCDKCYQQLRKEDEVLTAPSEMFIFHKNYQSLTDFGNLLAPSDALMEASKKHILVFHNIFESEPEKGGIKSYMLDACKNATPEWFSGDCSSHKIKILDFLLLVLLRKHCMWAVQKGSSKERKLKIIAGH